MNVRQPVDWSRKISLTAIQSQFNSHWDLAHTQKKGKRAKRKKTKIN